MDIDLTLQSNVTSEDEELRILILEDVPADAELVERQLRSSGLEFEVRIATGKESFERELYSFEPHLVLSDFELPRFNAMDAIRIVQERCPSTALIVVTGAVGEEIAVDCIRAGAEDYVLKDNLIRLPTAVSGALDRKREHALRLQAEDSLRKLSKCVTQSPSCIVITDAEGTIEYVNPKFTDLSGYTPEEVIGWNPRLLQSGHTRPEEYEEMWKTLTAGGVWRRDFCNKKKNGELYWVDATISPIVDADGITTHYVSAAEDITIRKEYEERLLRQANYDTLTGLPNRLLALDRLSQTIAEARRDKKLGTLLLVNLDGIQVVNEVVTREAGDDMLKQAARRLQECISDGDTVARLGGDEFLVVPRHVNGPDDAERLAKRIVRAFESPFSLDAQEFFLTVSIGLSMFPAETDDPHVLLREVDAAMRQAREKGANNCQFFMPEMNARVRERLKFESQLRHALERIELSLHYQPVIDLDSGAVHGAEALLRWDNPELGSVSPAKFIPIAEQAGLMASVGEWALRNACKQAMEWQALSEQPLHIGVNVSAAQFAEGNFVQTVVQALEDTGLPPHLLNLEITETLVMADTAAAITILEQLKAIGVSFALDDFGTGYSSLAYLRQLPIDTLKIDRMFVQDVTTDLDAADLIAGIIGLAHGLSLSVVAEGIETADQLDYVRALGCDFVQGFYFSKPLPATEFRAQLISGVNWKRESTCNLAESA